MIVGIVDTTFSRVNMGKIALDELSRNYPDVKTIRRTVPGIKDLAVECKKILAEADICMALGMVGGAAVDMQCAHEASLGIQQAKLLASKHIIEVFVHENEAWSEKELFNIFDNRIRKHVHNTVALVNNPGSLTKNAGMGIRQGRENEGEIGKGGHITIGIIKADFNRDIVSYMEKKAVSYAKELGIKVKHISTVFGTYDLPLAVKKVLEDKSISGIVVLGAIITGETKHDEVIAYSTAKTLQELSLGFNKPISLGIIGPCPNMELANRRKEEYAKRTVDAVLKSIMELRKND